MWGHSKNTEKSVKQTYMCCETLINADSAIFNVNLHCLFTHGSQSIGKCLIGFSEANVVINFIYIE